MSKVNTPGKKLCNNSILELKDFLISKIISKFKRENSGSHKELILYYSICLYKKI